MPEYFTELIGDFAIGELILILAGLSVVLYVLHIAANKLEQWVISLAVTNIEDNLDTVVKVQNKNVILKNSFQSCTRVFSGALIIFIACTTLVLISPEVGMFFSVCFFLLLLLGWLGKENISFINKLGRREVLSAINIFLIASFFIVFLYIVKSAIEESATDIFIQIIVLLIIRQIGTLTNEIGSNVFFIKDKEIILSSILFGEHYKRSFSGDQSSDWDKMLRSSALVLENNGLCIYEKSFFDTSHPMIDSVRFSCKKVNGQECYVIARVFWGKNSIQYEKEITIRDEIRSLEVFGEKIADITSEDFSVILIEVPCGNKVEPNRYFEAVSKYFRVIYALSIDVEFIERYKLSEKNSFNSIDLEGLKDLVTQNFFNVDVELFEWFFDNCFLIMDKVEDSPLALINKDLNLNSTAYEQGRVFINSWWHWALEPVGSGIVPEQVNNLDIESIAEVLAEKYGYSLEGAREMIMLNAYCYTFAMNCKVGFMVKACETLSQIRSIIDK